MLHDVFLFSQESLGGNARTSLVVAVADAIEHCDETLQSLQFGTRAMFVENTVGSCANSASILLQLSVASIPDPDRKCWRQCHCVTTQQHPQPVVDTTL